MLIVVVVVVNDGHWPDPVASAGPATPASDLILALQALTLCQRAHTPLPIADLLLHDNDNKSTIDKMCKSAVVHILRKVKWVSGQISN